MANNSQVISKPKLRGVIHLVMSPLSLITGIVLITAASELKGRITLGIFTITAGVVVFLLIVLGGLCYTIGGIIYALKKPNFNLNWFGFHELFHTLTAAAFLFHLLAAIFTVFGITVKGR